VLYCLHMTTTTLSVRVRPSTKSRLEKLAKSTGRSRAFLAAEAISAYLDTNEWQVAGIAKALASLDRGKGITHPRVSDWVASWETREERRSPRSVRRSCGPRNPFTTLSPCAPTLPNMTRPPPSVSPCTFSTVSSICSRKIRNSGRRAASPARANW
jgi:RHH-type transcriptional regulator, rel operon repressor / antitoxin RelB